MVSTLLPELELYNHLIETATTADESVAAISKCLSTPFTERAERTVAMAAETWPEKVERIAETLDTGPAIVRDTL